MLIVLHVIRCRQNLYLFDSRRLNVFFFLCIYTYDFFCILFIFVINVCFLLI